MWDGCCVHRDGEQPGTCPDLHGRRGGEETMRNPDLVLNIPARFSCLLGDLEAFDLLLLVYELSPD